MTATIKVKFELTIHMDDIRKVLEQRGIVANQANTKRLVDLIRSVPIQANQDFFETVPTDRDILLMYGFTFRPERS